ncbi:MAG: membrane protein [Hyphobacterium sp.]|nr:MAG: membrane protein [Hyphobacterium sp.]
MTGLALISAAIGLSSAVVSGVFLSFSDFIVRALLRTEPAAAIAAMQQINITVLRSLFLTVFLLLAPACLAVSVVAWQSDAQGQSLWIYAGTAVYVIGSLMVTIAGNVPMNNRLAVMEPTSSAAVEYWHTYGQRWTRLNTIRTLASFVASACFLIAAFFDI